MAEQNKAFTSGTKSDQTNTGEGTSSNSPMPMNTKPTTGTSIDKPKAEPSIKNSASGVLENVKSTAGEAYDAVAEKATTAIEDQKTGISTSLNTVAGSVRRMGSELGTSDDAAGLMTAASKYTDTAARKLENVANYFERTDLQGMMTDLKDFARKNPAVFLGGAFAAGVLAARFFRSSSAGPLNDSGQSFQRDTTPAAKPDSKSFGASAGGI
jgi:hypothetical protein